MIAIRFCIFITFYKSHYFISKGFQMKTSKHKNATKHDRHGKITLSLASIFAISSMLVATPNKPHSSDSNGGGGGDNNTIITPSDNSNISQESSTDFANSQSASQSNSQSTSFVDSTSMDSASIDSSQNPQSDSPKSAESKSNDSTKSKKSKKSKRYNKLTKNADKEWENDSKYDNIDAKQLDKVVVTASGYEQDIKNAPATISIIPKEEIMSRPIRDIGDAVQDVPGVSVEMQKTGGNSISMRGLGSNYTLILIDGKRQNVAQGFSTNGFGEALKLKYATAFDDRANRSHTRTRFYDLW